MKLPSIGLSGETLLHFEDAVEKEWIVTNGLGGYSSSTVLGLNTRKYHGLLVASLNPPGNRSVCLEKLDEDVIIDNHTYRLGMNEFETGLYPQGHTFLRGFSVGPFPTFVYVAGEVELQKVVFVPHEKNAVIAVYTTVNRSDSGVKVRVFPLANGRSIHAVTHRNEISGFSVKKAEREVSMRFSPEACMLIVKSTDGVFHENGRWVEKIYYREEAERGESSLDDCYQPGYVETEVEAGGKAEFALVGVVDENGESAEKISEEIPSTLSDVQALQMAEAKRLETLLTSFNETHKYVSATEWLSWMILAGDSFIVRTSSNARRTVVAGYHWFGGWGRDTFISLPGLLLVTARFEDAQKVFLSFTDHFRQGLIPNLLGDGTEESAYNAVDASLWYVNAVFQYLKYTGDFEFVKTRLWETVKSIINGYSRGTLFQICQDRDGLLSHGAQLTWMDAVVDGEPVTPRGGKAVEIQTLWYNALKITELLADRYEDRSLAEKYGLMAEKTRGSFVEEFWNSEKGCLFDVLSDTQKDGSLRPNQVLAVGLDFSMLGKAQSEKVVDVVRRELLTPYGLRTLNRNDRRYVGVYSGGRRSRDSAYHNGTVWPWLLGPFVTAYMKVNGYSESVRDCVKGFLVPLFSEQILRAGLGTVSEIFDGDAPFAPRGCISQAWSVAEPLRAYFEDVILNRPKYEKEVLRSLG